ncbi:secondary thiamine-phosphate synthase enzyme YjbQ [Nonomuraea roseoviolacea subsp. roseoviolacea]|uniref:Secondary thiamine-phosphate synthase enzyme n=1 Tax=Nonomuraea roseoviolacea subsp. carminata TaxID=160689 RepID=A0ABT1K7X4_9ACTN|nr:secondary thiamine-phosphate synthase enzyme YjbQ [Nonomuraea roseoviolacea]MCP2349719.1 secondary thiamine-phosphate synthase enzyme [Nonomuraea roseoviolacea subsp. carminata]
MRSQIISVATGSRETVHDITPACADFVREQGEDGLLHVFVPHATAGVVLIELGSGSDDDLIAALRDLLPADDRWRHAHGSRGHGRSHVMPALIPPYATVPVVGGRLALGTWQSIALVDLNVDNPQRQVRLSFLSD